LLKRNVEYVSCHIRVTIADGGPLMQIYYFVLNKKPSVCIQKPLHLWNVYSIGKTNCKGTDL